MSEAYRVNTGQASVSGWLFDVIDDNHLAGPFDRHEFQSKLLLHRREQ